MSPDTIELDTESKYLVHPRWNIDASTGTGIFVQHSPDGDIEYPSNSSLAILASSLYMYGGSYDEGRIFEDWQDTPALGTVKGIMLANESGIAVVDLTYNDFSTVSKTTTFSDPTAPDTTSNYQVDPSQYYSDFRWGALKLVQPNSYNWPGFTSGGAVNGADAIMTWGAGVDAEIKRAYNKRFDFTRARLTSAYGAGCDVTVSGFRDGVNVHNDTFYVSNSHTYRDFTFTDIDKLVFSSPDGQLVIDDFEYGRDDYLYELENSSIIDPLPTTAITTIIEKLEDGALVTVPVQMINHIDLRGYVYITESSSSRGFMFNMDYGGEATGVTIEDYFYAMCTDELESMSFDTGGYSDWDDLILSNEELEALDAYYTIPWDPYEEIELDQDSDTTIMQAMNEFDENVNAEPPFWGDPVNMVSGEFYQEELPDFHIKSRGFDLSLKRTYRSGLIFNGPFGFGWTWNHAERLIVLDNGNLIYYNNDSKPYTIFDNGDGTYQYPAGTTFTIVKNGDDTYTITLKNNIQFHFDTIGTLTQKEDTYGNTLTFAYNAQNQLETITDQVGQSLTFSPYNANGKVETVTDHTGRYCQYAYDSNDDLRTFVDLEGKATSYEYLSGQENPLNNHNMSKYILPNLDYLEISYYRDDTVAYHQNSEGETFNFLYSRLNRYAETWNEAGYYRKLFYNDKNDVIRVTTEEDTLELKEYDSHHNLVSHTDANGNTTTFDYGSNPKERNLYSKTNVTLNQTWSYLYGSPYVKHLPSKVTDPNTNVTDYEYWPEGKLKNIIKAPGYEFDANGVLVQNASAPGFITYYEYDIFGNLRYVTDPLGNTEEYTYDANGLYLLSKIDKNLHVTSYDYHPASITQPVGLLKEEKVRSSVDPNTIFTTE